MPPPRSPTSRATLLPRARRQETNDVGSVGAQRPQLGGRDAPEGLVDRDDTVPETPGRDGAGADVRERAEVCFG
jgi:hypothetical protein